MRAGERAPDPLTVLAEGAVELQGRLPWSSNTTLLARVVLGDACVLAVYKPHRGERPLWDFPDRIYRREAAAWVLSEALGWAIVPPTVVREGPLGEGSLQLFVDADHEQHYFTIHDDETTHDQLRAVCAFDLVANNTDRKSGHVLLGRDGRVWAIDNALCFHPQPKLRTVIWEFAGEAVPEPLLADVARVAAAPPDALAGLLSAPEIDAFVTRARFLLDRGTFPDPDVSHRPYPWPLV